MAKKESPFKTIDEQIEILKKRKLLFVNEEHCKNVLLQYGYYEIINGFKDSFLETKKINDPNEEDIFKEHTTFEHVFSMYEFDKNIQNAVLKSTLEVELLLKTALAYSIAKKYGEKQEDYLNRENYKLGKCKIGKDGTKFYTIDNIFKKTKKILNDKTHPFKHYREEYDNIPPWILLKGFTFGNCVHFLKIQKSDIKNEVLSILSGIPINFIENNENFKNFMMSVLDLSYNFRNRSAHSSRIYNYKPQQSFLPYTKHFHESINISKKKYDLGYGRNDLYTLHKSLKFLNSSSPFIDLAITFNFYLSGYLELFPEDKEYVLSSIGIPNHLINDSIENLITWKN